MRQQPANSGFTLVELLVALGLAVVIIGCMAVCARGFFMTYDQVRIDRDASRKLQIAVQFGFDHRYSFDTDVAPRAFEVADNNGRYDIKVEGELPGSAVLWGNLFYAEITHAATESKPMVLKTREEEGAPMLILALPGDAEGLTE